VFFHVFPSWVWACTQTCRTHPITHDVKEARERGDDSSCAFQRTSPPLFGGSFRGTRDGKINSKGRAVGVLRNDTPIIISSAAINIALLWRLRCLREMRCTCTSVRQAEKSCAIVRFEQARATSI